MSLGTGIVPVEQVASRVLSCHRLQPRARPGAAQAATPTPTAPVPAPVAYYSRPPPPPAPVSVQRQHPRVEAEERRVRQEEKEKNRAIKKEKNRERREQRARRRQEEAQADEVTVVYAPPPTAGMPGMPGGTDSVPPPTSLRSSRTPAAPSLHEWLQWTPVYAPPPVVVSSSASDASCPAVATETAAASPQRHTGNVSSNALQNASPASPNVS